MRSIGVLCLTIFLCACSTLPQSTKSQQAIQYSHTSSHGQSHNPLVTLPLFVRNTGVYIDSQYSLALAKFYVSMMNIQQAPVTQLPFPPGYLNQSSFSRTQQQRAVGTTLN